MRTLNNTDIIVEVSIINALTAQEIIRDNRFLYDSLIQLASNAWGLNTLDLDQDEVDEILEELDYLLCSQAVEFEVFK